MSRGSGFPIADVSVDIVDDPKFRHLARDYPDMFARAFTAYVAVLLASWKAGGRVTLDDAWPVLMARDADVGVALRQTGLLDAKGRPTARAWASWFTPAFDRRESRRASGSAGGRAAHGLAPLYGEPGEPRPRLKDRSSTARPGPIRSEPSRSDRQHPSRSEPNRAARTASGRGPAEPTGMERDTVGPLNDQEVGADTAPHDSTSTQDQDDQSVDLALWTRIGQLVEELTGIPHLLGSPYGGLGAMALAQAAAVPWPTFEAAYRAIAAAYGRPSKRQLVFDAEAVLRPVGRAATNRKPEDPDLVEGRRQLAALKEARGGTADA